MISVTSSGVNFILISSSPIAVPNQSSIKPSINHFNSWAMEECHFWCVFEPDLTSFGINNILSFVSGEPCAKNAVVIEM